MRADSGKHIIIVVISVLVVALVYSSFSAFYASTFYVFAAPPSLCFDDPMPSCENRLCDNNIEEGTATCCWTTGDVNAVFCQKCAVTESGDFDCDDVIAEVAPPQPPPGPKGPLGSIPEGGGILPELEQTPPSPPQPGPKGPLGTVPGGEIAPEVSPPTGPEDDNETQSRINTSPTGYCAPIRTPTCIPCDPGLPGSTCVPESDWSTLRGPPDVGTLEEAKPLVPPTAGETAPEVAPPSTAVEEPECPEGQELDEETGLCVLEEPPVTEQQEQPDEQEQSDQQDESN